MRSIQNNPKARSLLNIALGLFVLAGILNTIITGKARYFAYLGLAFSLLLIALGTYNFFVLYKDQIIYKDKTFGYLSLVIGMLFLIATSMNFYCAQCHLISTLLSAAASVIVLRLGMLLLSK